MTPYTPVASDDPTKPPTNCGEYLHSKGVLHMFEQQWPWEPDGKDGTMAVRVVLNHRGEFVCAYEPKGMWRWIQKYGVNPEMASPSHSVCSIGKSSIDGKWYGWSHRAMAGFGLGDRVYEEGYGDDRTPFVKHGSVVIENEDQMKQAAIAFASSVS